jgi:predicted metal-dependent hydrolase
VVVTLPPRVTRASGLRLLDEHAGWVGAELAAIAPAIAFADGSVIPFGGEPHTIVHMAGCSNAAWLAGTQIQVAGDRRQIPSLVAGLLQAEARRQLGMLVDEVGDKTELRPTHLAIRDPGSRWGSCSAAGTVMLSWRLVMAPREVQHYVVVHELAHLRHMNHGPQFWALVSAFSPGMAECVAWLHQHGARLMRVGPA